MSHFVSASCGGQKCHIAGCGKPAAHKVGEEMFDDDPHPIRHNATAYVCCEHFHFIMGNNNFVDSICPPESENIPDAIRVLHHDYPYCHKRLQNGVCTKCGYKPHPNFTRYHLYCPTCDLPLAKDLKCPSCGNTCK